jgi:hypothetical protein
MIPYDQPPCRCRVFCGDFPESEDDPFGFCKGLEVPPAEPLVEIILVPRNPPKEEH